MKTPYKSHGNKAKINPDKKIAGEYITNAVTAKSGGGLYSDDESVELAKEFSEENKK
jgi:hypothetical protein